jgi:ABC-type transport system involved in cytochrome c biogenesis ATPase subunit/GNAT superfamily N-acetyltransferase
MFSSIPLLSSTFNLESVDTMRRHEFFHVRKIRRTYDRTRNAFSFNISYSTAVALTPRTSAVAEAFGLGVDEEHRFTVLDAELKINPSDIVYITGDSGSGKSVLLRAIKKDLGDIAVDVADIQVPMDKPLIETVGKTVEEGLELLAKVGLGDAFLFLRSYDQLSDGQKYRYRLAKLVESDKQWWILDEFAATLDRDTAKIVAFNLQKFARQQGKAVLAATTHMDLFEDLHPSVHVHKRFGKEITIEYFPNEPARECSLVKEMRVEQGSTKDWSALASFHYRSHRISAPRKIFCLKRSEELCGVIVYCYPPSASFGRRLVLPRMSMRELNEKLSVISRVVVHPKYRTMGLGAKLVRETLALAGTDYVEMSAVMAKYNPFAEKAGMKKIVEQPSPKEAEKIKDVLEGLGLNTQLLSSTNYVSKMLQALGDESLAKVRVTLASQRHPRFLKSFSNDLPFGTKEAYQKEIGNASLEKLASLIKISGFLLQSKAYLFWSKREV